MKKVIKKMNQFINIYSLGEFIEQAHSAAEGYGGMSAAVGTEGGFRGG